MRKPNILYIHCHDAGRYIEPYGHKVSTPNLQALASEGVIFRNAFCTGPTCSPSRSALVTGQYPHVNGMTGLAHRGHSLNNYNDHIIHQLHKSGYTSALCGIQHVADNAERIGYKHIIDHDNNGAFTRDMSVAVNSADWLEQHGSNQPFFMSIGFFCPHRTFEKANPQNGTDEDWRYVKVPPTLPDNELIRRDIADYNHMVKHMDKCVGVVLEGLRESGQYDNTLIIATTDHGIAFPNMKCNLTDQGNGVYLIMRGSDQFMGGKCIDSMVSHLDIYPTICELLHDDPTHELHGKSLLPLVTGQCDKLHDELFSEVTFHAAYEPMRAVRTERFKLIKRFLGDWRTRVLPNCDDGYSKTVLHEHGWSQQEPQEVELYDLYLDPTERINLAHNDSFKTIRNELENKLEKWMQETSDPILSGTVPLPENGVTTPVDEYSPNPQKK